MIPPLHQKILDLAAFCLFALALAVPSGYSVAAVLLLGLGLCHLTAPWCNRRWGVHGMALWAATVAAMGLVWCLHMTDPGGHLVMGTLGLDRSSKYLLVLLALPVLWVARPSAASMRWGCAIGALSAGVLAGWQVLNASLPRAEGHTNAIQFGNLALLLALYSLVWALQPGIRRVRVWGWAGVVGGVAASVWSGSRGGWLVMPPLLLLLLALAPQATAAPATPTHRWWLTALVATVLFCGSLATLPPVQERIQIAVQEWSMPVTPDNNTSIGTRKAFWQLAWSLGRQHPWLGVGQYGYEAAQRAAVAEQRMPWTAVEFNHAHNEWLDMFAKRGLLGVTALALLYALPGVLFWRAWRRRQEADADSPPGMVGTAALCGLLTVLGFFGFGLTQVLFAHNNGNLVYLLSISLWLALALPAPAPQPSRNTP